VQEARDASAAGLAAHKKRPLVPTDVWIGIALENIHNAVEVVSQDRIEIILQHGTAIISWTEPSSASIESTMSTMDQYIVSSDYTRSIRRLLMKLAIFDGVVGLKPSDTDWSALRRQIDNVGADIVLTNEMPFGEWLASDEKFDAKRAENSIRLHDEGLDALRNLNARIVLSSRPVRADGKLANEAFALHFGEYRFLHQKHYFPQEFGFYEESWFETKRTGFEVSRMDDLGVGVLLCTELMFNERAREFGRAGADLIVTPRATGMNIHRWMIAGAMAAIASGCYVASANRVGQAAGSPQFGGAGFVFSPTGELLAQTSVEHPVVTVSLDLSVTRCQKALYPCYVVDRFARPLVSQDTN
jgi:N-carbamoylputrescine amidase